MLNLEQEQREVRSASANQVRRGLNKNSIAQSRPYIAQLHPFSDALEQAGLQFPSAES